MWCTPANSLTETGPRTPRSSGFADSDDRTVVAKDHDFLDGHLLKDAPRRLLLVTTGNIRHDDLITLIEAVEPLLVEAFAHSVLVEVSRDAVIGH